MGRYRERIFEAVPVVKRNIALRKLIDAAMDANNRQLECVDRSHDNMAIFYASIFILCMDRLRRLTRVLDDDVLYAYDGWPPRDLMGGYYRLIGPVRDWRKKWKRVKPLGSQVERDYVPERIIHL